MTVGKDLASRLRDRVTIQEANTEDNGRGGRRPISGQPAWRPISLNPTVAAEVIPLRGDEALRNSIERSVAYYRVTIRARSGVTTSHRLLWEGTPLNIKSAAPNDERDGLVMTCESGTPS